ncbi:MAG: ABC-2 family transporter protein [Clostridiaceae bacterium]|nr:ABC-2 family transporter protein [Clostridiaceae bacterium]
MISVARVHLEAIKISFAARMAYRGDFFISVTLTFLFEFISPLVILLIYKTGSSFPGFNLYEVLFIQGVFMISKGIAFMFFFGIVGNVLRSVREGTFDNYLLRPRSVLYLTIASSFDSEELGKLIGGVLILIFAFINIPPPSLIQWLGFLLLMIASQAVLFSFSLISSAIVFLWVGNSRVYEIFDSASTFGLYPRTIFSKNLQNIITFIVPVAMIGFMPASVLLGKNADGIMLSFFSSIIFLLISLLFWHFMLRKHTSAGG